MSSTPHNSMNADTGEDTLRLIARLPAPAGLEERVHKALHAAPASGRVLAWPARFRAKITLESNWMRATAAAAIVFVVVGGGWGVYSRVQPGQAGKVLVMPQPMPSSGGFSSSGAMRTPSTLPGSKDRDEGTKGTMEQETPAARKPVASKKHGAQPAASQHPTNQAAPQPAVSQ